MASPKKNIVLAFDLYGTILSTSSIASELAKHFGEEKAAAVAATWRTLQLEYTWRLNSMGASAFISPSPTTSLRAPTSPGPPFQTPSSPFTPSTKLFAFVITNTSFSTFPD